MNKKYKADSKIYSVLNNKNQYRSFKTACDKISNKKSYFTNSIASKKANGDIIIHVSSLKQNEEVRNCKNSNVHELFKLIEQI